MKNKLAIILPAYKKTFLRESLESIAKQTNKSFTLYIGNDASPEDLYSIVKEFESRISIVYTSFSENLGGADLVAQWERCIGMSNQEEWIWLFSDDDVMHEKCVEFFYKQLDNTATFDLYHFNIRTIDENGNVFKENMPFPVLLSAEDFFVGKILGTFDSYVVEYIFKREVYEQNNKFEKFDLGWCADDAAWMKFASKNGIKTIGEFPMVYWRYSGKNISSLNDSEEICIRKLQAKNNFLTWTKKMWMEKGSKRTLSKIVIIRWLLQDLQITKGISLKRKISMAWEYGNGAASLIGGVIGISWMLYWVLKKEIGFK